MRTLLVMVMCLVCVTAWADQKYNPYENRWETVPSDWEVEYNPFENDWSYQPEEAEIEYNPYENQWEWDSGNN